ILFRGTLIAQVIPVLLMPVITRLYTPESMGVFELFLSISLILGAVANGRYELSVVLPDKKEEAWNIMGLGMLISFAFSIFLLLIFSGFADTIAGWLNNANIEAWLIFVPLAVLFQGWFGMLNYYNTREKSFKTISQANVSRSVSRTGVQIVTGIFVNSPAGLILGQIAGFFTAVFIMVKKISLKAFFRQVDKDGMKKQGRRYKRFPLFTMPATLANTASVNLTGILISAMYAISSVGFYSLANRVLGMPGTLIGKSLSRVYHKEAVDQRKKYGHARPVFISTVKKLVVISLPLFAVIFVFAEDLFSIVFGEEWSVAGSYAKILIPLLFIRFIVAPVSVTLSVFEKQNISLYWQLGLLFLSLGVFALSWFIGWHIKTFLIYLVAILFFYYVFFIFILWNVASNKLKS
ncbi:MAG TPA: oligosaccharide flippase family protein, partial [Bacteroidales bacterium]|nr:oligosaccharide flippase family protein [Bacteroidales bacterium]